VLFHRFVSPLALFVLAVAFGAPGAVAAPVGPRPVQRAGQSNSVAFVWTNDEIDMLRESNVPISIVGLKMEAAPAVVVAAPDEIGSYDRTKDPAWYAEQAAILQAEMDTRKGELTQQQEASAGAKNLRQTDPGVAMNRGDAGITPEAGINNLEARVHEAQGRLDALADLARQNDIPPSVLRG
jgi:hypothetical protein